MAKYGFAFCWLLIALWRHSDKGEGWAVLLIWLHLVLKTMEGDFQNDIRPSARKSCYWYYLHFSQMAWCVYIEWLTNSWRVFNGSCPERLMLGLYHYAWVAYQEKRHQSLFKCINNKGKQEVTQHHTTSINKGWIFCRENGYIGAIRT